MKWFGLEVDIGNVLIALGPLLAPRLISFFGEEIGRHAGLIKVACLSNIAQV